MQHRVIETVNLLHQPLQGRAAILGRIVFQYAAGKKRNNGQRHNHRCCNRRHNGPDEALDEFSGAFGQKEKGQKGKDQNACRPQNRHRNLFGAVNRRFAAAFSHAQMPRNVLDDDNRVIDQQAQCQNEARDYQLAQVKTIS